jgi:hypothetical protein
MKKTLAAVTTAILAVVLAFTGVTTAANASTPVPFTVTTTSLTLPSPDVFTAKGISDASIRYIPISQYTPGQTYSTATNWTTTTVDIHVSNTNGYGLAVVGKSTVPFDSKLSGGAFLGKLPTTGYCVVWAQVPQYDQIFGEGGEAPVCTDPIKDASAAVSTTAATCDAPQALVLGSAVNATWGAVTGGTGPGTYSVTATVAGYHLFADGTKSKTFAGSLSGQLTDSSCATAPPVCIDNPTFSYTFDGVDSGTITVTKKGVTTGTLCKPLYVRAATWTYDTPINPANAGWPQTLSGYNDVTVSSLGTVTYQAPPVATCKQNDIYASFTGFDSLALPTHLIGPNNPNEPAFLHTALYGKGPSPTYYQTSTVGCDSIKPAASVTAGACYYDLSQSGSFKTVTFNYDNSASNVPVSFEVQSYPGVDNSAYNRTVPAGQVVHVSAQASWTGGVSYNVIANGDTAHPFVLSVPAFEGCAIPVAYEGDPTATPQTCGLDVGDAPTSGFITVFAAAHVSYLIHNTDVPSVAGDVTVLDGNTPLPVGHYAVTAKADAGFVLTNTPPTTNLEIVDQAVDCQLPSHAAFTPDVTAGGESCHSGGTTSGYIQITPGDGLSYFLGGMQLTSARTAVAPGTYVVTAVAAPGDTVLGTNPITVTVDPLATSCADLKTLAFTGAEGTAGFLGASAILLLIGAALVFVKKSRRIREGE